MTGIDYSGSELKVTFPLGNVPLCGAFETMFGPRSPKGLPQLTFHHETPLKFWDQSKGFCPKKQCILLGRFVW